MKPIAAKIKDSAILIRNNQDFDAILESIGDDTQVVMIGEATHGTHEFYKMRAEITKRLIQERGFTIVATESDWPDSRRIHKYIRSLASSTDTSSIEALSDFQRFPRWMWRNMVMVDFVEWAKQWNLQQKQRGQKQIGFFGLDLYSLNSSMEAVVSYLEKHDPELAKKAKKYYSCFDRFGGDSQTYGYKTGVSMSKSCEREVMLVLTDLLNKQNESMVRRDDDEDDFFDAKANAKVVKDAELYYRQMFTGVNTWNLRDQHMLETLDCLIEHHTNRYNTRAKAVIWAHNSHLGDAFYTGMKDRGEFNLGQLVRERFGMNKCFNIGFTTFTGSVTAAHNWDEDPQFMKVKPGMEGSYEKLLHDAMAHMRNESFDDPTPYCLIFRSNNNRVGDRYVADRELIKDLERSRYERAIGVIYRPATELFSHYFKASLPKQFDAVIHVEKTLALFPLEIHPQWVRGQREHAPSAYPGIAHLNAEDYEFEGFFDPSHYKFGPNFINEMYHSDETSKKRSSA